jgi:hypothetical protein
MEMETEKSSKLGLILVVLLLLVGAFAGGWYLAGPKSPLLGS